MGYRGGIRKGVCNMKYPTKMVIYLIASLVISYAFIGWLIWAIRNL